MTFTNTKQKSTAASPLFRNTSELSIWSSFLCPGLFSGVNRKDQQMIMIHTLITRDLYSKPWHSRNNKIQDATVPTLSREKKGRDSNCAWSALSAMPCSCDNIHLYLRHILREQRSAHICTFLTAALWSLPQYQACSPKGVYILTLRIHGMLP